MVRRRPLDGPVRHAANEGVFRSLDDGHPAGRLDRARPALPSSSAPEEDIDGWPGAVDAWPASEPETAVDQLEVVVRLRGLDVAGEHRVAGIWMTTQTAAGRSGGRPRTMARIASRPPAKPPMATRSGRPGTEFGSTPVACCYRSFCESTPTVRAVLAKKVIDDPALSVLIIEDDPAQAQMYRRKFEGDGYEVTVAADGEAGLQLAIQTMPDLVFLDIRLPKMDGLAVLEAIRRNPATEHLPVVILTNLDEDDLRAAGARLGVSDWLIKSQVTPGGLSARVSDWADVRPKAHT